MEQMNRVSDVSEVQETKSSGKKELEKTALDNYNKLLARNAVEGDNSSTQSNEAKADSNKNNSTEKAFETTEKTPDTGTKENDAEHNPENEKTVTPDTVETEEQEPDYTEKREPNSQYELNGNIYETDDNGQTYKKNGKLLPNIEYTVNGNTYKTDANGRKVVCNAVPKRTEDGPRDNEKQRESGGEERRDNDDGGHIVARILGGAEGDENLVPMRSTINRGDYKKMENEIAKALEEGKEVTVHIELEYDGDSERPSKIKATYTIDGKTTVVEFDNEENSTELLESLKSKISEEQYNELKEEIEDWENEGIEVSITSVKIEYDENGNPVKITVCKTYDTIGLKEYETYEPQKEE
jgi:hypothetical protein